MKKEGDSKKCVKREPAAQYTFDADPPISVTLRHAADIGPMLTGVGRTRSRLRPTGPSGG